MLSAARSTLTVGCTDNCEGPGVGLGVAVAGTRCRTMTSKLCPELPAPWAPHSLITTWSATEGPFHFLPVTVLHSRARGGGPRGTPSSPPVINSGAQSPGRRNLTVYPGAIFDYSEWLCLRVCPGRWRRPPPHSPPLILRPPLEMSRQPVLCAFPWLASGAAAVHWYVHSSRPAGLTGSDSGFYHIWPSELWGCQPASIVSFLCFDWLCSGLGEWWDLGVCGEGKPLSQVQRTFNSFLVFWSVWARAEHTGSAAGRGSVYKRDDDPTLGRQRGAGFYILITLLR